MLIFLECLFVKCHIIMQIYKSLFVTCQMIRLVKCPNMMLVYLVLKNVLVKCHIIEMQIYLKFFW